MIAPERVFGLLGDQTRLRCLSLLHQREELCVCELVSALGLPQPKISRHLSLLRTHGLITDQRKGQWIYYRLSKQLPTWLNTLLKSCLEPLQTMEPFASDLTQVARLCRKC